MPAPVFPAIDWVPGDGRLVRVVAGSQTRTLGGVILELVVVDCRALPDLPLAATTGDAVRFGDPLRPTGTTVWIRGVLHVDRLGETATTDFAVIRDDWLALRSLLLGHETVEVHVYAPPEAGEPVALTGLRITQIRAWWHDPGGVRYELGACSTEPAPE
jgi:hypothetical protein